MHRFRHVFCGFVHLKPVDSAAAGVWADSSNAARLQLITPITENQMEKKMENEMETGII